jgi:PAS domain S-box-containing protein
MLLTMGIPTLVWIALAWTVADTLRDRRAKASLAEGHVRLQQHISGVVTSVEDSLRLLHRLPALVGNGDEVRRVLRRFAGVTHPSVLPSVERREHWLADEELKGLDELLDRSEADIGALSVIYVVDLAGDCIAASNFRRPDSFIGSNYGDREYFRSARAGQFGRQFAVGRVTGIPGLFFSAPVEEDGRVIGVIAGKADVSVLTNWVRQVDAFIVDPFGAVVLARSKALEGRALPNAGVQLLGEEERRARYKKPDFEVLSVVPWGDRRYPGLQRFDGGATPVMMASQAIPQADLSAWVVEPVPEIVSLDHERWSWFALLALVGPTAIVLVRAATSHVRQTRGRLDATITSMGDGVCVLDSHGIIRIANPVAEALLGARDSTLTGRDLGTVVSGGWPPELERRQELVALRGAIQSGSSCRSDDGRFMTLAREWLPVSFVLTPIDDRNGSKGSVLVFRDIRAAKESELALRQSEARFRAIFELAAFGIVTLTPEGIVTDCNEAHCRMMRDTRDNLVGRSFYLRLHKDDEADCRRRFEMIRDGVVLPEPYAERRYTTPDGAGIWVVQTASFLRDQDGRPTAGIGVAHDITRRKHLEMSLSQALKLEAVGRLAAGIAHEINTPVQFVGDSVHFVRDALNDLFGLLALYRRLREAPSSWTPELSDEISAAEQEADVEYLAEQIPRSLDRALDGLERVATIVRGMKDFGHPDQKDKAPADINRALGATLAIARNEYKYVADVETEFGALPPVVCHVGELNQVFLNIIVNAAHAIGDVIRGTESKGRIRIRTWTEDQSVLVAITDTGGGIPEEVRDKIFEPFFTTKEVGRGTGQGLAIARSVVVEKHGGELTFETQLGRGTTFVIRLPIEPSTPETTSDEAHPIR